MNTDSPDMLFRAPVLPGWVVIVQVSCFGLDVFPNLLLTAVMPCSL